LRRATCSSYECLYTASETHGCRLDKSMYCDSESAGQIRVRLRNLSVGRRTNWHICTAKLEAAGRGLLLNFYPKLERTDGFLVHFLEFDFSPRRRRGRWNPILRNELLNPFKVLPDVTSHANCRRPSPELLDSRRTSRSSSARQLRQYAQYR
jgi:hypothetical protein